MKGLRWSGWAFAMLAAGPLPAKCTLAKLADLPVTMSAMQPLTDIKLNGRPIRLMVDSGAFYSLLTPGSAAELGLALHEAPAGFYLTGTGGSIQPSVATAKDLTVGRATLHNVEFLVGGSEVGSAGVLGQNFLHLRDAEYDLAGGMIRLMDAKECEHANLAYWAKPDQAVSAIRLADDAGQGTLARHIIGTVMVNGVALQTMFDTGASTTSLTVAAAGKAGVHLSDPGVEEAGRSSGIGRRFVRRWLAAFKTIQVGDEQVRNTRLAIVDNKDRNAEMVIGADFFLSHHVYVANRQHLMFFTYNGGPVFRLPDFREAGDQLAAQPLGPPEATKAAEPAGEPTDAAGFVRRGAARLARHDPVAALADLDQAVARAPDDPRTRLERARVHLALRQPLLAATDLDRAVALAPDEVEPHLVRAGLRLGAHDRAGAREDVDAAARLAPRPADTRLAVAHYYQLLDLLPQAIEQYNLWIAAHPEDVKRAEALNGRCWSRALADVELPQALADCDGAVRRQPRNASFLDSRGLVRLRLHDHARAIADYDAALAIQPKLAFSLQGRGLAKLAQGDMAGGRADLAEAAAIEPDMPARARRYGLAPPS